MHHLPYFPAFKLWCITISPDPCNRHSGEIPSLSGAAPTHTFSTPSLCQEWPLPSFVHGYFCRVLLLCCAPFFDCSCLLFASRYDTYFQRWWCITKKFSFSWWCITHRAMPFLMVMHNYHVILLVTYSNAQKFLCPRRWCTTPHFSQFGNSSLFSESFVFKNYLISYYTNAQAFMSATVMHHSFFQCWWFITSLLGNELLASRAPAFQDP